MKKSKAINLFSNQSNFKLTKIDIEELFLKGYFLHQQGFLKEAKEVYNQVINAQPDHFDAIQLTGAIAIETKCFQEAVHLLKTALSINPNHYLSIFNYSIALQEIKKFDAALAGYEKVIKLEPNHVEAYFNSGVILQTKKAWGKASCCYDKAIKLRPNYPEAYYNRGLVLEQLEKYIKAIESYDKAITLNPNYAQAHFNKGNVQLRLQQYNAAIASYDKAIEISSTFFEAYTNLGLAFQELKMIEKAIENFEKAITLNPNYAQAHFNKGNALIYTEFKDECYSSYLKAFELKPDIPFALSNLINIKMQLCDWGKFDELSKKVTEETINLNGLFIPIVSMYILDNPEIHKQQAITYAIKNHPMKNPYQRIEFFAKHKKIRIGYFSADFREHAVSHLTAELFKLHSREEFEIIAFSFGTDTQDCMRSRLEKDFDNFLDVNDKSEQEIAMLARAMEIDIAIDLGGYTGGCRTGIFAIRAAPIQITYLGYPGTMGANYFDYIIADATIIPETHRQHYVEKVVSLPGTFMVNDSSYKPSEKSFTRSDFNLPQDAFVFACFNVSHKITPTTFAGWMRILSASENSVLWLSSMNETAIRNIKIQAAKQGIKNDRIIFAPKMPLVNDHLNRIRLADLFLDTFPYNAHTTANDALRVGLPVITKIGESFASRVAASLLNAVGLPELITAKQEAYESLAIELATSPHRLRGIKNKLLVNLPSSPLLNTKLHTENLERAYKAIYQRHQQGLGAEHITIQ